MSEKNTLSIIAEEIGRAFLPVSEAAASLESFISLMQELGWDATQMPQFIQDIVAPLNSLMTLLDDGELDVSQLDAFVNDLKNFIQAVRGLSGKPNSAFAGIPDPDAFKTEFPEQLIQFLLVEYLLSEQPHFGELFRMIGVIREEEVDAAGTRLAYIKKSFAFSDIVNFFSDPLIFLKNAYNWGSAQFKKEIVFENALSLAEAYGIDVHQRRLADTTMDFLHSGAADLESIHETALRLALLPAPPDDLNAEIGLAIAVLPEAGAKLPGLALVPYGDASFDEEIALSDEWGLRLEMAAEISRGVVILVRPGEPIDIQINLADSATAASIGASFTIEFINHPTSADEKLLLLGSSDGSRFEISSLSIKGGGRIHSGDGKEVFAEFNLNDASIVIQTSEDSDSFINSLVPEDGFSFNFNLLVGLSTEQGLYFGGSGGLEISLPVHISFGPIEIDGATLALKFEDGTVPVDLGANIKGALGPLAAVIQNIGLRATFTFPNDQNGNLGPVNIDMGFKWPTAVGLSIDAQGIKGGGFVEIDRPNHRYAGVLQLEFQGAINLTAIGLITTKLPGGLDGFSLLILISAEFQPIQLGMGFTLNGVGGLLGYNRTMVIDVLRQGVQDNSLKSILFPEDPVANAMEIISDLRAAFPPYDGQFVIGPMAKIGYGTPTLISLELGLVIEIPDPFRIAILGVLKTVLPDEKVALIKIQVNFLGTIDFEAGKLTFDASLFDSRLLAFELSGDMAVRVFWKGDPQFLFSVGGFHPAFAPPPLDLPDLRRLAIQLLKGDNPRLRLETYLAVTSNTVQFGARLELYAAAGSFNVYGFLSFDVLFQFSPFYFIASIGAMLALRAGSSTLAGISLALSLEGTTPWKAKGTAKLKLFWFLTVKVRFSKTWGDRRDTLIEDIAVLDKVVDALQDKGNWQSDLTGQRNLLVSLKEIASVEDKVIVHPCGGLTVSQKIVPLNVRIDKFGNAKPSDFREFTITEHQAGNVMIEPSDITVFKDFFAPAQFFKKSDTEKLSADSYVKYDAGFTLGMSDQLESSLYVKREVEYELSYIDSQREIQLPVFGGQVAPVATLFNLFTKNRATARSPLSHAANRKSALAPETIEINQEGYAVAYVNDLTAAEGTKIMASEAEAIDLLNKVLEAHPEMTGKLQVIPAFELNDAEAA